MISKRFRPLIEGAPAKPPEHAWIAHVACVVGAEACGWTGWTLEGGSSVGALTVAATRCPNCGSASLFRLQEIRMEPSEDQRHPLDVAGVDYEILPIEYCD